MQYFIPIKINAANEDEVQRALSTHRNVKKMANYLEPHWYIRLMKILSILFKVEAFSVSFLRETQSEADKLYAFAMQSTASQTAAMCAVQRWTFVLAIRFSIRLDSIGRAMPMKEPIPLRVFWMRWKNLYGIYATRFNSNLFHFILCARREESSVILNRRQTVYSIVLNIPIWASGCTLAISLNSQTILVQNHGQCVTVGFPTCE